MAQLLDDNPCGHRHDNGLLDGMALACKSCAEKAGTGYLWDLAQVLSDLDDVFDACRTEAEIETAAAIVDRRAAEIAVRRRKAGNLAAEWYREP